MAYQPLNSRQVKNAAALLSSIGSAANSTLDVILGDIDSVMVNLTGTQTLTNKTLAFLKTNVATDSTTTGSAATLQSTDIQNGVVRLTNSSLASISGIPAGGAAQQIILENKTGNTIVINNNDSGASAGNRIYTQTNANVSLANNTTATLVYDSTSAIWIITAGGSGASNVIAPTVQRFTSGSGTYTLPSNPTPLYIEVEMVGGGAGGNGSGGGAGGGAGGSGADSLFGSILIAGGAPNPPGNGGGVSGTGGTYSYSSPAILIVGAIGQTSTPTVIDASGNVNDVSGANGAPGPWGGAGSGNINNNGVSATANSGAGGGGAGSNSGSTYSGGGGAAGGYLIAQISNPSSTYSYTVGTGGTGGSPYSGGSFSGGAGGSGLIIVREYYQ